MFKFIFIFTFLSFVSHSQSDMLWTLEYDNVKPCLFKEDAYWVYQDGKMGLINREGKVFIPFDNAQFMGSFERRYFLMKKGVQFALYDIESDFMIPYSGNYQFIIVQENIIRVCRNSLWGILDMKGKEILPCQYKVMYDFLNGFTTVNDEWGKEGVINTSGELVIPLEYEAKEYEFKNIGSEHYEGIFIMKKQGLFGMVNTKGEIVCPFKYQNLKFGKECNGLAVFKDNDLWGYMNFRGEIIVPAKYKTANGLHKNRANVQNQNGLWGYIDETGNEVIPCQFIKENWFDDKYECVQLSENKFIFIDNFGKNVMNTIFDSYGFFISDNLVATGFDPYSQAKYAIYHKKKHFILPPENKIIVDYPLIIAKGKESYKLLDTSGHFLDTFDDYFELDYSYPLGLKKNGKWGFIDKNGKYITTYQFDTIRSFGQNHFTFASKNQKWGVIDKKMQVLVPFEYDASDDNVSKAMIMLKNGKQGLINIKGEVLIPFIYDKIETLLARKLFIVIKNNKKGLVDIENQLIIPVEYDEIKLNTLRNTIIVKQNDKFGAIDLSGKLLINIEFESIQDVPNYATQKGFIVGQAGKYGFANLLNQLVIPCRYERIKCTPSGYIIAEFQSNNEDLYKESGKLLGSNYSFIGPNYGDGKYFKFALVQNQTNLYGIFFQNGKSFPCEYIEMRIWERNNPIIVAKTRNKELHIIDNQGNILKKIVKGQVREYISPNLFTFIDSEYKGFKIGIIDTLGNFAFEPIYDNYTNTCDQTFILEKNNKKGVYDIYTSENIIPLDYDDIKGAYNYETHKCLFICKKDNKYGIFNKKKKLVFPFEYDNIEQKHIRKDTLIGTKNNKKYILEANGEAELMKE